MSFLVTEPHWRWTRAQKIVSEYKTEFARAGVLTREDPYVARAVRHLSAKSNRLPSPHPEIEDAYTLFSAPAAHAARGMLEPMLLVGMSNKEIADELPVSASGVELYEKLFFNVRPYLDKRAALCAIVFKGMPYAAVNKLSRNELALRMAYLGRKDLLMELITCNRDEATELECIEVTRSVMRKRALEFVLQGSSEETGSEQLKIVLDRKDDKGGKSNDQVTKATAEFLASVALTVADPTVKDNLALPAKEPRMADYSGKQNET